MLKNRIMELEGLLKVSERKSDILTNLLKEASAEYDQALEKIKVSEEKFRTIINSVRACIITTDMDRTISMINKAGSNMFGYQDEEILSRSIEDLFLDTKSKKAFLDDLVSGQGDTWHAELPAVTADKTVFPTQISLSGIKGATGENVGNVGIIRDISEEREVRRMKEDLVGMITHDMITPILSLQRAIQFILEMSLGPLSNEQTEIMRLALATTHQLFGMTNNLLDIYRNESGKFLLNQSKIDLHQIIQESISQLRFFAKDKKLTIAFEPTLSPLELNGDQIRLMRTCANLLDNAIRFSPEGSTIQVTSSMVDRFNNFSDLATIPAVFREKILAGHPYILTCVLDQGHGIPEKDKEAIFNKFFTTRITGETRRKGVGLGLAFCKLAIEAHLGQIWVNSPVESEETDLQQGCRICFLLPAVDPTRFSGGAEL
jgi:PAS domain S-box-containing protein